MTGFRIRKVKGRAKFEGYIITSGGMVTVSNEGKFSGNQIGWGGYQSNSNGIYWGFVQVNSTYSLSKWERQAIYMHEWGHALGIDHAKRPGKLMSPLINNQTKWTNSDKRKFRKVSKGCKSK